MTRVDIKCPYIEFERVDAAGIDDFDRDALGRRHHPRDVIVDQSLWQLIGDHRQQNVIIAEQTVAAGIEIADVGHLRMSGSGVAGDDRRFEASRVAHVQITLARHVRRPASTHTRPPATGRPEHAKRSRRTATSAQSRLSHHRCECADRCRPPSPRPSGCIDRDRIGSRS